MTQSTATIIPMNKHQITAYNEFRAELAQLKEHNSKLIFDYEDPKGNKDARSHIYKLRKTKSALDKARAAEKAASLDYGRRVDAEAKEITAEIEDMIAVHQRPLDEIEQREKIRIAKFQAHIDRFKAMQECRGHDSKETAAALSELEATEIGEDFGELQLETLKQRDAAIRAQRNQHDLALKQEAETAELERLRKEAEERQRQDRESQIAAQAAQKARQEFEAKAKAEADLAEKRELELRLNAERAEREKLEIQQQAEERERRAAENERQRIADEAAAKAAEEAKREADRLHVDLIHREIAAALTARGVDADKVEGLILAMRHGNIPHIKIVY